MTADSPAFAAMYVTLVLQLACAFGLAGITWYRQLATYPLLARAGRRRIAAHASALRLLDAMIVGPLLLVDLLSAVVFLTVLPPTVPVVFPLAGIAATSAAGLLALVPKRRVMGELTTGFNAAALRRLFRVHWFIAFLCSVRAILAVLLLGAVLGL